MTVIRVCECLYEFFKRYSPENCITTKKNLFYVSVQIVVRGREYIDGGRVQCACTGAHARTKSPSHTDSLIPLILMIIVLMHPFSYNLYTE